MSSVYLGATYLPALGIFSIFMYFPKRMHLYICFRLEESLKETLIILQKRK